MKRKARGPPAVAPGSMAMGGADALVRAGTDRKSVHTTCEASALYFVLVLLQCNRFLKSNKSNTVE
jgi:hypothetical protein